MTPFDFDHELRKRVLRLRQSLNRRREVMNHCAAALESAANQARKSELRLAVSTARLANCMRAHGL